MKHLILFLLLLLPSISFSSEVEWIDEFVSIYQQADQQFFGRSTNRTELLKEDVFNFNKGRTQGVNHNLGYLTAVTVNKKLKEDLDALLLKNNFIDIKGRSLRLVTEDTRQFYVYRERERSIFIGFSLEKASDAMLSLIATVYENEPEVKELVTNYYKENYVIRIYQAGNFYSRESEPQITDIMFNATLLGDKEQLLIGVHDGNDFLGQLREFYQKKVDYSILTDQYNDKLER